MHVCPSPIFESRALGDHKHDAEVSLQLPGASTRSPRRTLATRSRSHAGAHSAAHSVTRTHTGAAESRTPGAANLRSGQHRLREAGPGLPQPYSPKCLVFCSIRSPVPAAGRGAALATALYTAPAAALSAGPAAARSVTLPAVLRRQQPEASRPLKCSDICILLQPAVLRRLQTGVQHAAAPLRPQMHHRAGCSARRCAGCSPLRHTGRMPQRLANLIPQRHSGSCPRRLAGRFHQRTVSTASHRPHAAVLGQQQPAALHLPHAAALLQTWRSGLPFSAGRSPQCHAGCCGLIGPG